MNDEKTNKIMSSEELDDVLPKYEHIKLSGKNLAQNYVSAFNTGMNIYQCVNQLQGYIEWVVKAVNDVVKSWNVQVGESIDQSKAIVRETTTEQFNTEWANKQPELIEQVNTLTTNQFNNEKSVFNDELDTLNERVGTLNERVDTLSNPNLLINSDFKVNQRGESTYDSQYSVDRWRIYNALYNVSTKNLSNPNSSDGNFIQIFENILNGIYTVTIHCSSVTGHVNFTWGGERVIAKEEVGDLKEGNNIVTINATDLRYIGVLVKPGASVIIDYIKLEQGSFPTPFIAPNPVEEYPKCQRYFQYIPKLYCVPLMYTRNLINSSDKYFQSTNGNLPTEMRIKPTLKYKALGQSDGSTFANNASFELDSKSINTVALSSVVSNFSITVNEITLDAEIY